MAAQDLRAPAAVLMYKLWDPTNLFSNSYKQCKKMMLPVISQGHVGYISPPIDVDIYLTLS